MQALASGYGFSGYGAAKRGLFHPGYGPATLWRMDPTKRKLDFSGLLSAEDTLVAVARGMQPSFVLRALEDRAAIKGGLTVLRAAGAYTGDVSKLKVTVANLPKDDEALLRAAGGGGSGSMGQRLSGAARKVRSKVVQVGGDALATAAWGARGLLVLATMPGFLIAHTAAGIAVNFVPIVGQIVSAASAGHIAVTQTIAKKVAEELKGNLNAGLRAWKAQAAKREAAKAAEAGRAIAPAAAPAATGWLGYWPWALGALVIIGGGAYLATRQRRAA
mgnify:CR=1 FL=1